MAFRPGHIPWNAGRQREFWATVQKSANCWTWMGALKRPENYGFFYAAGKQNYAHRVSWEMLNGPVPAGMFVCHRCDNPSCVRPDHLFLGTALDNNRDAIRKGRKRYAIGSKHGNAVLDEEAVREIRNLHKVEGVSYSDIGREFGVHRMTVYDIVKRRTWRHVA